ncbi:MAG: hypothetical protein KBS60_07080 [Phascolarctobacterium sp.]|nr:hypothetical protein [Candidatus Phascolarctobacterium caballi]
MTSAFTMFAAMVNNTQSIPFKIEVDPFYSQENMEELRQRIADIKSGKTKLVEHELIEVK